MEEVKNNNAGQNLDFETAAQEAKKAHLKIRKSKAGKFFKNAILIFSIVFLVFILGGIFLFFVDSDNHIRSEWFGLSNKTMEPFTSIWFGGINILNIHWLVYFVCIGIMFMVYFFIVFHRAIKNRLNKKQNEKHDRDMTKGQKVVFNLLFLLGYFVLMGGVAAGAYFLFSWDSVIAQGQILFAFDEGSLNQVIEFAKSLGLLTMVISVFPILALIIWLLLKLLIGITGGLGTAVSERVMSTETFQEAFAAAQAVTNRINEQTGNLQKTVSIIAKTHSDEEHDEHGHIVLFPALTKIDAVNADKEAQELLAQKAAADTKVVEAKVVEVKPEPAPVIEQASEEVLVVAKKKKANKTEEVKEETKLKDYAYFKDFIVQFRAYLANKNHIYFDEKLLRGFVAGLATSRLILLEGLSGTGKSTLPRVFLEFIGGKAKFYPVQATWRDKTDVIGYYSDLTGTYKETELLKGLYEATYNPHNVNLMVLDEMNISRAEYYFADFLSTFEYPQQDWLIQLMQVRQGLKTPKYLENGAVRIQKNTWFIGTINIDDSTFTVTDKVYDRALVLDFQKLNTEFTVDYKDDPRPTTLEEFEGFFKEAQSIESYQLNNKDEAKFLELVKFVDEVFDVRFGNRIMNQIRAFVPVYVALGGTLNDALDIMFARKVLRKLDVKFESYMEDGLIKLSRFMTTEYGKGALPLSEAKVASLRKKFQ